MELFGPGCHRSVKEGATADLPAAQGGLTASREPDWDIWTKYKLLDETFNILSLLFSDYLIRKSETKVGFYIFARGQFIRSKEDFKCKDKKP